MRPQYWINSLGRARFFHLVLLLALLVNVCALSSPFWAPRVELKFTAQTISPESGQAYTAPIAPKTHFPFELAADTIGHLNASSLTLTEDGVPLGPAHSNHADIRASGHGRYSHWNNSLYFSSSDGSDPRDNGRQYRVRGRLQLWPSAWIGLALADLVLIILFGRRLTGLMIRSAEIVGAARFKTAALTAAVFAIGVLAAVDMAFPLTVIAAYLLTVPGMYLVFRLNLASSILEGIAAGFFLGFGVLILFYLGLSWYLPIYLIHILATASVAITLLLMMRHLRRHPLPIWINPRDGVQTALVSAALLLMLVYAFGYLATYVDDDSFIHFPTIARIALGDIPPHVAYYPSTYLRGHIGRDLFIGTIAHFINLRPDRAIVYATLACCPAYILTVHALARRLAGGARLPTCFCFFGLLFLVSTAVGPYQIRSGAITHVVNNNAMAFGYAAFFGWLCTKTIGSLAKDKANFGFRKLLDNWPILALLSIAHAASYSIYLSNFLMFSVLIAASPIMIAVVSGSGWKQRFIEAVFGVATFAVGAAIVLLLVSPFFLERILVTLNLLTPSDPTGFLQQAHFSFPKVPLFSITSPNGDDVMFFTYDNLAAQGLSFYLGFAVLFAGVWRRNLSLVALSSLGLLTMLWLMTVDMGEFRGEPLRLMLLASIGLGGSAGLFLGLLLERLAPALAYGGQAGPTQSAPFRKDRGWQLAALAAVLALCAFMARGNVERALPYLDPVASFRRMAMLVRDNPEKWNKSELDYNALRLLSGDIKSPSQRLLLNIRPDPSLSGPEFPTLHLQNFDITMISDAATITAAGIVGVAQEYGPPHMSVALFPFDYRASLFWSKPTADLLAQLSPDWILFDPALIAPSTLDQIMALPGVTVVRTLSDGRNNRRILLHYAASRPYRAPASAVTNVTIETKTIEARRSELIEIAATVEAKSNVAGVKLAVVVADENGHTANATDMPIAGAVALGDGRYRLQFTMIQAGNWMVYFADPATGVRLSALPLRVLVKE